MQKTGKYGLIVARGTGDQIQVTCEAEPFDTGDVVRFVVRTTPPDLTELLVKEITSFTDGAAIIQLTESDTLSLAAADLCYGINIIRSGEEPQALIINAPFVVVEAVARDEQP